MDKSEIPLHVEEFQISPHLSCIEFWNFSTLPIFSPQIYWWQISDMLASWLLKNSPCQPRSSSLSMSHGLLSCLRWEPKSKQTWYHYSSLEFNSWNTKCLIALQFPHPLDFLRSGHDVSSQISDEWKHDWSAQKAALIHFLTWSLWSTSSVSRHCHCMVSSSRAWTFDITFLVLWVPRPEMSTRGWGTEVSASLLCLHHFVDNIISIVVGHLFYDAS